LITTLRLPLHPGSATRMRSQLRPRIVVCSIRSRQVATKTPTTSETKPIQSEPFPGPSQRDLDELAIRCRCESRPQSSPSRLLCRL